MYFFRTDVLAKLRKCMGIGLLHLALLIFCTGNNLFAQGHDHLNPAHATTYEWSLLARLQLLDETHAYTEPFYDRGFNRVYTPLVKREYELDTWTQAYQFDESYSWYKNPYGYRMRFGSYSKGRWAVFSQLHTLVNLGASSDFQLSFYPHQHARGSRALVEFGYQHSFDSHKLSVNHTLSEFKQDLDLTISYENENERWGHIKFDVTIMNHLNNIVNKAGNEDPKQAGLRNLQTSVKSFPVFFFGRYRTPHEKQYHLDVSFGIQPRRIDEIIDKKLPNFMYEQQRFAGFINSSLDIRMPYATVGGFFYLDHDNLTRSATGNPFDGAYHAEQTSRKTGAFLYGYFNKLKPFIRISREKYTDQQHGDDFSISVIPEAMDYHESRWILDAGVNIRPFKALFFVEFRYMSLKRDNIDVPGSKLLTESWTNQYIFVAPHNNRFVYSLSFVASNRFHFEVGGAYDIDADVHPFNDVVKRFDKGFAKLIAWF